MQLDKLEIKGFKSFGEKVTIQFDEGITGIVGPNGCGKSNVVDAIRWVLGEQKTRMLRSEKMENIIFNGTKKRKATQLAEVSLTFSNTKNLLPTEYTEITITRRYYRSGDSEYQLNGVSCRLKDITNLFMDTGISSNSYAIIELKMVDDILNDKDNSRRALFEEAAGISKFKSRKKETLRKLGETDEDLDRVEDLLFEIEKNLKSLEKQAKQAEKYYKHKEDYKAKSVSLARLTVADKNKRYTLLTKTIEQEKDKKLEITQQITRQEAALEKSKTQLITLEKELSAKQKSLNEHVHQIRQYENERKIKSERLTFLEDKSDNLREQLEADKKSNERAAFSLDSLRNKLEKATKELVQTSLQVEQQKEIYATQKEQASQAQATFETQRKAVNEKKDALYQLRKQIEIKEIQLQTLQNELDKTASDSSEQSETLEKFDEKLQSLTFDLERSKKALDKQKAEEEKQNTAIQKTSDAIEVVRNELTQTGRKLDSKRNEYDLTKSLVENLEGFPEAIKFLKKKSNWNKEAPLLSDIIACDEKYRVTIENYLDAYMNYYIVDTERQAFDAVNILSDASKGKANFFILNAFDHYEPSTAKMYDQAIPATQVVEYEAKYKKLISHILGDVFIVNGGPGEIPLDEEAIFITESGQYTKRKFSIAGGSVGLFEGKRIGRAKNLEKLQKEIKKLESKSVEIKEQLEKKQQELARLKSASFRVALEELQSQYNQINSEYVSVKTKKEQLASMLSTQANRKESIATEIDKLKTELLAAKPDLTKLEKEHAQIENGLEALEQKAKSAAELLTEKSQTYNEANLAFHQKQNKTTSLQQEIEYKTSAYEGSKQRIAKNQEELSRNEGEIKKLITSASTNEDELITMYDRKEAIEKEVNQAEKNYYNQRGDIDVTEKTIRELRQKRELADTLLTEQQNKLNETRLELNSVKERLSVEFQINLEEILSTSEDVDSHESAEELSAEVQRIKDKIERMGPINSMAMEAFDEIQERHTFITEQRDDLIEAKDSLIETISEIDAVAKKTFMEAFAKIKSNFIEVFRSLFTEEDDCDLKLSNPEEPLESSIEIIAKPKGKRPLTINQLSGGEKTLTATSLLFAFYLLKPAPFCIFDEVDAPLDDANIDKFNNIIKTFSKDSQFIIVTHNKRTMSSTDIIYGITMIEQGISRVVPVDLRALEAE